MSYVDATSQSGDVILVMFNSMSINIAKNRRIFLLLLLCFWKIDLNICVAPDDNGHGGWLETEENPSTNAGVTAILTELHKYVPLGPNGYKLTACNRDQISVERHWGVKRSIGKLLR